VVSYGGYITPDVAGAHFLGAHYSHGDDELTPRSSDTEEMLRLNAQWLPTLSLINGETTGTRVCFRTSTIDRLPYIGALPDYTDFKQLVAQYRSGTNLANKVTCAPIPGIFVNVGHGSRGLLSCPIGGEIIAREIVKEPLEDLACAAQVATPERLPLRLQRASNLG
jgi:tRNA 5-methylaminomethyl-2-thiouridine biosynthesis bifunctional protein